MTLTTNIVEVKMKTGLIGIDESKRGDLITKFQIQKIANDPFEPSLKLHRLQGNLEKFHTVRLTYEYEIVLVLLIIDEQIILVDIGTHDDVYK